MTVLRLEMLPAAQGDALLLEWGTGRRRHRMLVDAGPARTYRTVHERVKALGRRPKLDLMVVTHIDGDHLEGVVRLLLDRAALGLTVEDTWFNGWPQVEDPDSDVQGPDQGEMVGAVLRRDRLKWNDAVAGKPLLLPDGDAAPPVIPLPGDAQVTVLGPGPAQLATLRKKWVKVLKRVGVTPGDARSALERLARRPELAGIADVQGGDSDVDSSEANGASICLLFEHAGRSVLLTGDGHGDVLAAGLRRLAAARQVERVPVDLVKLPHHGSKANVTDELLGLLDSSRFLVSTNGSHYHHPDKVALRRILTGPTRTGPVELVFNYRSETTEPWAVAATQRRLDYTGTFPDDPAAGAVIQLD